MVSASRKRVILNCILAFGMLAAGTINTLVATYMNNTESVGISGNATKFDQHPTFQTAIMFSGEFSCLAAFYLLRQFTKCQHKRDPAGKAVPRKDNASLFIFAVPAICDFLGTTTMYIGLTQTDASTYQMLRGFLVPVVALFSVVFLKMKLRFYHYLGILLIVIGIILVALSSIVNTDKGKFVPPNPALGDILVIVAQLFTATQFVVEEKYVSKYDTHPLKVVGGEGMFGLLVCAFVLPYAQLIPVDGKPLQDSYDAIVQLGNSPPLVGYAVGSFLSIAFFNFFGISVTKELSAMHRTTIDACRTFAVWIFQLALGNEKFSVLKLIGSLVLTFGTFMYNGAIPVPTEYLKGTFLSRWPNCFDPITDDDDLTKEGERAPLNGHNEKSDYASINVRNEEEESRLLEGYSNQAKVI